jgi:hypothetical protein
LTEYPLDIGVYEWAMSKGYFNPERPSHRKPSFVGRFTSGHLRHSHFVGGRRLT